MEPSTDEPLYWDPVDPALRIDPYPVWRRLREEAPAWYNDRHDFWALSRFADVESAHRDWHHFSSAYGTTLELMTPEPMRSGMILVNDPPKHTLLRTLVSRAFTTRRVSALEESIRRFCGDRLDELAARGSFDYVQDFGALLPPWVIARLLGVPDSDQLWLRPVVDAVFHIEDGVGMTNKTSVDALITVRQYLGDQMKARRSKPADDMLTALVHAEIDDEGVTRRLTDDELMDFGLVLFVAGTETVARLIGWAGSILDVHPDQRSALAEDPSKIPNAIEELLRFEPPSPVQARRTTADVVVHGHTIPAGSRVILITGSAARDERAFDHPDRFDISRKVDLHLSFGYGIHFCLGAALARMEGRIALEETLARFPSWTVDRENAEMLYTSTVRGFAKLPITVG
jgi:cytochrome P450